MAAAPAEPSKKDKSSAKLDQLAAVDPEFPNSVL